MICYVEMNLHIEVSGRKGFTSREEQDGRKEKRKGRLLQATGNEGRLNDKRRLIFIAFKDYSIKRYAYRFVNHK